MVDALRSERSELMLVEVQVLSSAPIIYRAWGRDLRAR